MRQRKKVEANKKYRWMPLFIVILSFVLITCLIYIVYLYNAIQTGKTKGFTETEEYILANTDLVNIEAIEPFYDQHTYHVVFGMTKDEEQQIIFIPINDETDNATSDITVVDQSDIIPKEQVLQQVNDQCQKCKIMQVQPAIIDENPLWEITYRDTSNRFILDYISMYDGSRFEQLRFKQMFK